MLGHLLLRWVSDLGVLSKGSDFFYVLAAADEGGHSSGGLFGKLKDKTKKASSKIKSKVAKRHSDDPQVDPIHDDDEEEYEVN